MRALLILLVIQCFCDVQGARLSFSDNGPWGVVVTKAYEAAIARNGVLVFKPVGVPPLRVSLLRRWVTRQEFPEMRLARAECLPAQDGASTTLRFQYHWDGAEVEETLFFDAWGVDAKYVLTPWAARDLRFLTILMETRGTQEGWNMVGTVANNNGEELLQGHSSSGMKGDFAALSLRGGPTVVDVLCAGDSIVSVASKAHFMLRNCGKWGEWRTKRKAGEPMDISFRLFVSSPDARNFPASTVKFEERSGDMP